MYQDAALAEIRPPKEDNPNIVSIKRFVAPASLSNGLKAYAFITVKESKLEGDRIYSVEVMDFELVQTKGESELNVRNIAAALGCSTQPVMYQFPDMDTLKDMTYQKADAFHTEYILAAEDLLEIGLRYIRFAKEEPQLFRFLFQSGRFSGFSLEELIKAPEAAGILSVVSKEEKLTLEEAAVYFEPLVAIVHGYACLIANNAMKYESDAIRDVLVMVAEGLKRRE